MARVEAASMAWGLLTDVNNKPLPNTSATLKNLDGTNATTWSAIIGGSSSTSALTSDGFGILTGYFVEEGTYTLTASATTRTVEASKGGAFFTVDAPSGVAATDTANIQTQITAAGAAGGGTVMLRRGEYIINAALTFPEAKMITVRGQGMGSTGGVYGTRLNRVAAGTNLVINATGSAFATANRPQVRLCDLEISGNSTAAEIAHFERCSHATFERVRFANSTALGVTFRELYDSRALFCLFENMGNGTTNPATILDAVSGVGGGSEAGQRGTATMPFIGCIWQSNTGVDLKLTGNTGDGSPTNEAQFIACKMEGTGVGTSGSPDTYPYIDLDYAQNCKWVGLKISIPTGRAPTAIIQQITNSAGPRANIFTNTTLDVAGTNNPTRYIDHAAGAMTFNGLDCPATLPSSEYIRIQSSVTAGRFRLNAFSHNSTAPYSGLITDSRTTNEELGKGHVALVRHSGSAAAATVGSSTVWNFTDPATNTVSNDYTGQIEIPRDADPNGQCRVRLYWSSATTGNGVHWRAISRAVGSGEDFSTAGTTYETVASGPGTAHFLQVTTLTSGPTSKPGGIFSILLQRIDVASDDTHTGTAYLVKAEIIYDKRI